MRQDPIFQRALSIGRMPSSAPIRVRRAGAWAWSCVQGINTAKRIFPFFPDRTLPRARLLAGKRKLLVTLNGAHDTTANREQLMREQVDYLIKWNPRSENPESWKARAEARERLMEVRPGKRVTIFDEIVE